MGVGQDGQPALSIRLFMDDLEGVPAVALTTVDGEELLVVDDSLQSGAEGIRDAAFRVFTAQIDRLIEARRLAVAN